MEKISIVVSTYGRFEAFKLLINSIKNSRINREDYEIIVVSSDQPDSEKVKWVEEQSDIDMKLFLLSDRTTVRTKSLMYYENIGIKNSKYEWIFVVSDDMYFEADWYEKFLGYVTKDNNVYIVSCHLGSKHFGFWIPPIGTITKDGVTETMWLYDMTIINSSVYEKIGYLDEQIHWFGKGADLPLAIAFLTNETPVLCHDVKINHDIINENRQENISTTPNGDDFVYIVNKWEKWLGENPDKNYSFVWKW
jgi:glycosyltransferase involved in cell wall biosynthesis